MIRRLRDSKATGMLVNLTAIATVVLAGIFLLPGLAGYERYVITGASMSGTFERGSLAFAESVPVEELEVGDIITYLPPPESGISELVTHRIVDIDTAQGQPVFQTQGDANDSVDPWIFQLEEPTQARVEATVPGIGWVFIALADREARMLIIGIPAAMIGLLSLIDLIRALREPESNSRTSRSVSPVHC
ncbi:signal peptidase I [Nesterenkonia sp. Act20]|uniref:signal peptidase I n=1 Tax=Nesterenkonia sp. Act20 TaxID=1483432 RepID=UPI001C4600E8|nr:signal peptidase I [Nesterenkonia sp. Act20]